MIVTPIVLFLIYAVAYYVRPKVTDEVNRRYYFWALHAKVFGALALGFLYQFYYNGGDTYNFHTRGSREIWNAFVENPTEGGRLLFHDLDPGLIYKYHWKIPFLLDPSSFFVIQLSTVIDFFTFSSYSATALAFASLSFMGGWMLFLTFYKGYHHLHKPIAMATLFIPSVIFWGSGLLKDTITLACIGFCTYIVRETFAKNKMNLLKIVLLLLGFYIIFTVKKYILLCFMPAILLWFFVGFVSKSQNLVFKILMIPLAIVISALCGYYSIVQISKNDPRYALERLGETARITAYDIAYQTGRDAGSTYSIGELDGTFLGLVKVAPQGINVSLFRPYLWEVRNPLMLLSALESAFLLITTVYLVIGSGRFLGRGLFNADVVFCFVFSITFAFAVGVSTFNFGTLSRYKIPLMPFYLLALILLNDYVKRERNLAAFESTE